MDDIGLNIVSSYVVIGLPLKDTPDRESVSKQGANQGHQAALTSIMVQAVKIPRRSGARDKSSQLVNAFNDRKKVSGMLCAT
ncbi:MAG TPA: hypothetical protein VN664_17795 [Burkholderiales bacterium]|jgi:hypothetical protein|nr:hypothetical protein [Burkholderiales bacterium]